MKAILDRARTVTGLIIGVFALVLGMTAPVAADTTTPDGMRWYPASAVVGQWDSTIERDDGVTEHGVLTFASSGRMTVRVDDGGIGRGTWRMTGKKQFTFQFVERIHADGEWIGDVHVEHDARLDATATKFSSAGTGTLHDPDGEPVMVIDVSLKAAKL